MKSVAVFVLASVLVSCASPPRRAALTEEQATALAEKLANDKTSQIYRWSPAPENDPKANLVDGRWTWKTVRRNFHGDYSVTVGLALDGSTNSVDVKFMPSGLP